MNTILRRLSSLVLLLMPCVMLAGCNAYMLQGKVIRGNYSDIQLVYAGDERLDEEGVPGAEVRVSRDPTTLNRHLVGRSRTSGAGEFTLVMDEFGTGWMQEEWLLQAVAGGYQNAETMMQLPSKNSKWRLLVTLAPGTSVPLQDQDQTMQDLERFKQASGGGRVLNSLPEMLSLIRPHIRALVYCVLTAMVGLAAMNNQNNLLFWVFGMLVAALALSLAIATTIIRRVQVRRLDPHYGAVGEPLMLRYAVVNRSRWLSVFNVEIEEIATGRRAGDRVWRRLMKPASAWVMHAGPREIVHGEAVFWPSARGEAAFDRLRVWTTFPFGIIRRSKVVSQSQHTLIYPMLYELRRGLLGSIAPIGLMGSKIAHHAGAGDDYFGLREYRPGDSMRHISWKRTARTDQLVTIERTAPAPAKLRVVLDLTVATESLPGAGGDRRKAREMEERAISLAASLIHAADLDGFEVGLTVLGLTGAPPIAVRRNQWHFHKMMAALAEIDLDAARSRERPLPVRDAERAAIVIIAPDRVQPLGGREDALHLTSASLDGLAVRAIGWQDAGANASASGVRAGGPGGDRRMPPSSSATATRTAQEVTAA